MTVASLPSISIIIPVFNEATIITDYLAQLSSADVLEILIIDGGSRDETVSLAQAFAVKVLASPQTGRAQQMNYGASLAQGDILFFLHLDSQLPPNFAQDIRKTLAIPGVVAGAFRFAVDQPGWLFRGLEKIVNWRSQVLGLPYGDQGLFVPRATFWQLGGFADLPIMEDYEWVERVKQKGKLALAASAMVTSGRRWQRLGLVKTTLINQIMLMGYHGGIAPDRLAKWYRRQN